MAYTVKLYDSTHASLWNGFIGKSKNGTFLFHRDFMDYHSDRFEDFSLMVFEGEKLVAAVPANRVGDEVHSHQGLSYGGPVYDAKIKQAAVVAIFSEILRFLYQQGIKRLHIKPVPYIYHLHPSQETEYALFLANATLVRRDALAVIESAAALKTAANRMEGIKKGIANGFEVKEEEDFTGFWEQLLEPNLEMRHGAKPVHTLQEIMLLKQRFPQNIRLFMVYHNGKPAAGTVLFETPQVVHAQYIASDGQRNETGSLDFLYYKLITGVFAHKKYFDFGMSNEQQGRKLNGGLSFWKESFGARTAVHDFYMVETANFNLADDFLI